MKKKVYLIFGTRPEAIKMAPIALALKKSNLLIPKIIITAQHREMLDQVLKTFGLKADFDLNIMKPKQSLFDITTNVLLGLNKIFGECSPDFVLVHGDTSTTLAASLASFYYQIPVGHVEAGLRTGKMYSPFPEEINRKLTCVLSTYHFAPTERARENLIKENVNHEKIIVTGNTVVDALSIIAKKYENIQILNSDVSKISRCSDTKIILVTIHRRENFGEALLNICNALKRVAHENDDVQIIFPVHPNPNINILIKNLLGNTQNISLINPLNYESFVQVMLNSYLILTDSSGIQEEAPYLGKPVLVMRNDTERPEAVEGGTTLLVGTDIEKICMEVNRLLSDFTYYSTKCVKNSYFGDGKASSYICEFLESELTK